MNIRKLITDFGNKAIRSNYEYTTDNEKTLVKNVLGFGSSRYGLMHIIEHEFPSILDYDIEQEQARDVLIDSIKESIMKIQSSKENTIKIFRALQNYVEKECNISLEIAFPPTFTSEVDRQLHVIKMMQEGNGKYSDIAEELWVSERTIQNDIRTLTQTGIKLCGMEFSVKDYKRSGGRAYFTSTMHPIVIPANLSEVLTLLIGLEKQYSLKMYSSISLLLAQKVWIQLTDYAKKRILDLYDVLGMNTDFIKILEKNKLEDSSNLFSLETESIDRDIEKSVLIMFKSSETRDILVHDENGHYLLKNARIVDFNQESVAVISETLGEGAKKWIPTTDVIAVLINDEIIKT